MVRRSQQCGAQQYVPDQSDFLVLKQQLSTLPNIYFELKGQILPQLHTSNPNHPSV